MRLNNLLVGPVARLPVRVQTKLLIAFLAISHRLLPRVVFGCSCSGILFRSGKAVLRPVACGQVRGACGRGQGSETVTKRGGLPPSGACVWHRLEA
jgi:hypothetical protein